jgi:hypothetical protein
MKSINTQLVKLPKRTPQIMQCNHLLVRFQNVDVEGIACSAVGTTEYCSHHFIAPGAHARMRGSTSEQSPSGIGAPSYWLTPTALLCKG